MVSLKNTFLLFITLFVIGCSPKKTADEQLSDAKSYISENEVSSAIITLKSLLQETPEHTEARFLLGKSYWLENNFSAAKKELDIAKKNNANSEEITIILARIALGEGDLENASQLLTNKWFETEAFQIESLVLQAQIALSNQNLPLANELLESAKLFDSEHTEVLMVEILLLAQTQSPKSALTKLTSYSTKKPLEQPLLNLKAQLEMYTQDYSASSKTYASLHEQFPEELNYIVLLSESLLKEQKVSEAAQVLTNLNDNFLAHPAVVLQQAKLAIQQKDYTLAKEKSSQVLSVADHQTAQMILGLSHFYLNEFEEAYYQLSPLVDGLPKAHMAHKVLAVTQFELGYTKDIINTMENIDIAEQGNQLFFTEMGSQLAKKGATNEAEKLFNLAKQSAPQNPDIWLKHGIVKLANEDESGIEDLIYAQSISPDSTQSNALLILAYIQNGDLDKALAQTQTWLQSAPDNPTALLLQGNIAQQQSNYEQAKKSYQAVLKSDVNRNTAFYNLAVIAKAEEDIKASNEYLRTLLSEQPSSPKAYQLFLSNHTTPEQQSEARTFITSLVSDATQWPEIALSASLIQNKDFEKATSILENNAHKMSADTPNEYFTTLLTLYSYMKKEPETVALFSQWITHQPTNPTALILNTEHLIRTNNTQQALRTIQEASNNKSLQDNNAIKFYESYLLLLTGQTEQAQRKALALEKITPQDPAINQLLGQIAMVQKQYFKAEKYLTKSYHAKPNTRAGLQLAQSLVLQNKQNNAISFLEAELKTYPEQPGFHKYLAELYIGVNQTKAIKHYQHIADTTSNDPVILNNLAWLLNDEGDSKKALIYAEKAYKLMPNNPDIIDTLAVILIKNNDALRAEKLLQDAKASYPKHQGLAKTLASLKDKKAS